MQLAKTLNGSITTSAMLRKSLIHNHVKINIVLVI